MDSGLGASAHAWSRLLLPPLMGSQLSPPHSCLATTATLCPQQEPGAGVGRLRVAWWHLRMGHCSGCPCAVLAAPWHIQQVTRAGGSPAHFCSRYLGHPGMSLQYSWGSPSTMGKGDACFTSLPPLWGVQSGNWQDGKPSSLGLLRK